MNKIYKIVWNKARNCYVVASEFAKNHQTGSSRIKAASVAAVMAATMLTIGTDVIYAAKVKPGATFGKWPKQTILFDNEQDATTKLNDPNLKHPSVNGHTNECGELTYDTTLTIGDINNVVDKLVDNDNLLYSKADQAVEVASKGWKISTNGGNQTQVAPGDTVDFTGDSNIGVSNNGKQVKVELSKNLIGLESVTSAKAYVTSVDTNDNNSVTNVDYVQNQINGVKLEEGNGISIDDKKINVKLKEGEPNLAVDKTGLSLKKDLTGIESMTNSLSSIRMGNGGTVTINNVVTIDQSGKISGVAAGEVKEGSTDAVNGSQLKGVENKADKNAENIQKNTEAIAKNTEDISKNAEAIGKLDERVTSVEKVAKKHTTVSTDDKNVQIIEDTNEDGGKDYKVSLNKDLNLSSVTTGDTTMDTNGVTVKDVSLTKDGLSIGDKTYVSKDGLNANNQTITNVADGKVEKGSTDAVNGGQLYETNQAIANNATNISSLSHSISNLDNRVNKVGAGAAALAALHPLDFDPDAKWDFAAGYGNYRGANAAAVGAYYRPNEDTMFSVGGTFGNGENMVNAGVSFKLGSGSSHVSTSRVAMAKEIKELRGELEAMKSAMLDANAGKKIDTSKLQLFPDVPQNHWAYEYVAQLAGNGMSEGYPDGNFAGDRPMTRYEFAAILYRAMTKGAVLSDKILSEFSHELEYFTVDTIAKDKAGNPTIQRVRTVKENKNK